MKLTASDWDLIEELLPQAREQGRVQRDLFLQQHCADRPQLRAEVEALIEADESGSLLDGPVALSTPQDRGPAPPGMAEGSRLGAWRIRQRIGQGGMGEVYIAERADGRYAGRAAIKLLHRYLVSAAMQRRFAREGQLLGRLSHPHIARLLDAGTSDDGQPFLVLEYVDGQRLDHYCDRQRLSIIERIMLSLQICDAVAHAHANLIVHRDLKPSNIFVDADQQVKLLDFGIAKLVENEDAAATTQLTRLGERPLTPAYAAPEQIRDTDVTTATDVYSLGVVLYELLCGVSPYGQDATTAAQLQQAVLEAQPEVPSRMICSAAQADSRNTTLRNLRQMLSGDLDTIVGKALEKEPVRRYSSALALAEDLSRFLNDEPIAARPPSLVYRVRKFASRHTVGLSAAMAVVIALAAGVAGTIWQAQLARQQAAAARVEAKRAERAAATTTAVSNFMNEELLGGLRTSDAPGDIDFGAVLDRASRRVDERLADFPAAAAQVHFVMGRRFVVRRDRQLFHLQRAATLYERVQGPQGDDALLAAMFLADSLSQRGRFAAALDQWSSVRHRLESRFGRNHRLAREGQMYYSFSRLWSGDFVGAIAGLEAARRGMMEAPALTEEEARFRARSDEIQGPAKVGASGVAVASMMLANSMRLALSGLERAETLGDEALQQMRDFQGRERIRTVLALQTQAELLSLRGKVSEAYALLERGDEIVSQYFSDAGPLRDFMNEWRAIVDTRAGRLEAGLAVLQRRMDRCRGFENCSAQFSNVTRGLLADAYLRAGKVPEAIREYRRVTDAWTALLNADNAWTIGPRTGLAEALQRLGRLSEARAVLASVTEETLEALPADSLHRARWMLVQAQLLHEDGQTAAASSQLEKALALYEQGLGNEHWRSRQAREVWKGLRK